MDPLSALTVFGPLLVEAGKAVIGKVFGQSDFKPATVSDWATMQDKNIETFKAINSADGGKETYKWVEAVIKLQRPFVVLVVSLLWCYAYISPRVTVDQFGNISNLAGSIWFYLFGDRTLQYIQKRIDSSKGTSNGK